MNAVRPTGTRFSYASTPTITAALFVAPTILSLTLFPDCPFHKIYACWACFTAVGGGQGTIMSIRSKVQFFDSMELVAEYRNDSKFSTNALLGSALFATSESQQNNAGSLDNDLLAIIPAGGNSRQLVPAHPIFARANKLVWTIESATSGSDSISFAIASKSNPASWGASPHENYLESSVLLQR